MKRHRICKIALVLSFLLYALSPLTYDLSARSMLSTISPEASERTFRNASLYLIEILYEVFFDPQETEKESSPNRVLIRKKSALQRGRYTLVAHSSPSATFAAAALTSREQFSIAVARAEIIRPWFRKCDRCLPLSSGLSPPILS
jgi:hypothetical protein